MKYYIDLTNVHGAVGILFTQPENEAVYVGTTVHTEDAKLRDHPLVKRYAEECDFHFFFNGDTLPELYTVPGAEVGGYDSQGGLFVGGYVFSLRDPEPMYYIDRDKKCWLITENSSQFADMGLEWRDRMVPTQAIEAFASREEADRKYNIWEWEELLQEGDL